MQVGQVSGYSCAVGLTSAVVAGVVMAVVPGAGTAAVLVVGTEAGQGAGMAAGWEVVMAAGQVASAWEAVGMVRLQSMPHEHVMSSLPAGVQAKDDREQAYPWTGMRQHGESVLQFPHTSSAGMASASYHPGACQLVEVLCLKQLGAGEKQTKRTAGGAGAIDSAADRA